MLLKYEYEPSHDLFSDRICDGRGQACQQIEGNVHLISWLASSQLRRIPKTRYLTVLAKIWHKRRRHTTARSIRRILYCVDDERRAERCSNTIGLRTARRDSLMWLIKWAYHKSPMYCGAWLVMLIMISKRNTDAGSYGNWRGYPSIGAIISSEWIFSFAIVRSWARASSARIAATNASASSCLGGQWNTGHQASSRRLTLSGCIVHPVDKKWCNRWWRVCSQHQRLSRQEQTCRNCMVSSDRKITRIEVRRRS